MNLDLDTIPVDLRAFAERHKNRHPSNERALEDLVSRVDAFLAISVDDHLQAALAAERRGLPTAAVRCRQWAMRRAQAGQAGKTAVVTELWRHFLGERAA